VIKTPVRLPRANAYAERWVRTVRTECLDWMLVFGRRHLVVILRECVQHYNEGRPHRGLGLGVPLPGNRTSATPSPQHVRRHEVRGGLVYEYEAVTA
jgi:putative transposase